MPVNSSLIAAWLGKPGDLRHAVANRDQGHPTVSAAAQANTGDLAQWHVDHPAHPQSALVQIAFSSTGEDLFGLENVALKELLKLGSSRLAGL